MVLLEQKMDSCANNGKGALNTPDVLKLITLKSNSCIQYKIRFAR